MERQKSFICPIEMIAKNLVNLGWEGVLMFPHFSLPISLFFYIKDFRLLYIKYLKVRLSEK